MVTPTATPKPDYVTQLEAVFGPPSQAGFGTAVFYDAGQNGVGQGNKNQGDLEQAALEQYRFFVGDLWERYGAAAWQGAWQPLYTRPAGASHAIVAELRALPDRAAAQSAGVLLDDAEDPQAAQQALAAAFDDPAVTTLTVYRIGDGAALSGLLIAGHRQSTGDTTTLIFLMD